MKSHNAPMRCDRLKIMMAGITKQQQNSIVEKESSHHPNNTFGTRINFIWLSHQHNKYIQLLCYIQFNTNKKTFFILEIWWMHNLHNRGIITDCVHEKSVEFCIPLNVLWCIWCLLQVYSLAWRLLFFPHRFIVCGFYGINVTDTVKFDCCSFVVSPSR